jgi:hypothetical protein
MTTDTIDEYMKLGKTTTLECVEYYCSGIIEYFGDEFLCRSTIADTQRLLAKAEERGFSSMLGSIDYMHWQWHNYPVGWQGQFTRGGGIKHPIIILETVAFHDRWFWHAFVGVTDSNNDINVLNQSPLFVDVIRGRTPKVSFTVNGHEHHIRYYLADDIYPFWPVFVKGVPVPQQEKHRFFSMKQTSVRKDVKCAFSLLKKRFNILVIPVRSYSERILDLIMRACIILHNMIIDDERDDGYDDNYHTVTSVVAPPVTYEAPASLTTILQRNVYLTSGLMFSNLQSDLIEHVWNKFH